MELLREGIEIDPEAISVYWNGDLLTDEVVCAAQARHVSIGSPQARAKS